MVDSATFNLAVGGSGRRRHENGIASELSRLDASLYTSPILAGELRPRSLALQSIDLTIGKQIDAYRVNAARGGSGALPAGVGHKTVNDNTTREVDKFQTRRIMKYVVQYPIVLTVMERTISGVLKSGIGFRTESGVPIIPTRDFSATVQQHWATLVSDMIWAFSIQGFAPVAIGAFLNTRGTVIPYVPKIGTYQVLVTNVRGRIEYIFNWINANGKQLEYDDKVMIYTLNGSEPSVDGSLNSRFAAIVDAIYAQLIHEKSHLVADVIRSNPTQYVGSDAALLNKAHDYGVVTAPYADSDIRDMTPGSQYVVQSASSQKIIDIVNASMFADPASASANMPSSLLSTTGAVSPDLIPREEPVVTDAEMDLLNAGLGIGNLPRNSAPEFDTYKRVAAAKRNMVPLGIGRRIEKADRAQLNEQIVKMYDTLKDTICTVLQVPPSLLYHKSDVRGNIHGQNRTFEENLLSLAKACEPALNDAYDAIYGVQERQDALEQARRETISAALNALKAERYIVERIGLEYSRREEIEEARRAVVTATMKTLLSNLNIQSSADAKDFVVRVLENFDRQSAIRLAARSSDASLTREYLLESERRVGEYALKNYFDPMALMGALANSMYNQKKVNVVIPILPNIETSEILVMNSRGVLPYPLMAELWSRKTGLNPSEVNASDDKWDEKMVSSIALGTNVPVVDDSRDKQPAVKIKGRFIKSDDDDDDDDDGGKKRSDDDDDDDDDDEVVIEGKNNDGNTVVDDDDGGSRAKRLPQARPKTRKMRKT